MEIITDMYEDRPYKWTVGTVNYKSTDWLFWQLQILYSCNNPKDFELIIFDSMYPRNQKEKLMEICKRYSHHKNIKLMFYQNRHERGVEHGHEMNCIVQEARGRYFLSNDPDFFWLIKNYLKFLEDFFKAGYGSSGVLHQYMGQPAMWCSAYLTNNIRDFNPSQTVVECPSCKHRFHYLQQDTGWQYNIASQKMPVMIFPIDWWKPPFMGPYSYAHQGTQHNYCISYFHIENNTPFLVGVHMFRGSYPKIKPPTKVDIPNAWKKSRNLYGKYFLDVITGKIQVKPLFEIK
jgi:hypothetical protein